MILEIEIDPSCSTLEQEAINHLASIPERDRSSIARIALARGLQMMLGQSPSQADSHQPASLALSTLGGLNEDRRPVETSVMATNPVEKTPVQEEPEVRHHQAERPVHAESHQHTEGTDDGMQHAAQIVSMFRKKPDNNHE